MDLLRKNTHHLIVLAILGIFSLLLFKDLFSARTLIPNLEPYPDSLYYIVQSRNLAEGQGLVFSREGRPLTPNIPPLYSLVISPAYLVSQDPRMFYFVNILLAISSFYLFFKILKIITKNNWIINLTLFFYATNFFIYWYPTIPMAENLNLFLFVFGLWVLLQQVTFPKLILMAFLPLAVIATKYANAPLMFTFLGAFIWKIFIESKSKEKFKNLSVFTLSLVSFSLSFFSYEYVFRNHNLLTPIFSLFSSPISGSLNGQQKVTATGWFSIQYVNQNLPVYLNALIGQPMRFLWDFTPIIPGFIGLTGLIGLVKGGLQKDKKLISVSILVSIFSTILFLSTFYSADGRYIYFAIPSLLIGFAIFLDYLSKFKSYRKIFYLVLISLFIFYQATNFNRIKSQIALNLKHAETPWYYVSVLEVDKYFSSLPPPTNQKIAIISPMPPFLFDLYSTKKYTMLPLSKDQEFRDFKETIWGPNDYSNLTILYESYINQGFSVYVAEYGMGNEGYLHQAFDQLNKDFDLTKVHDGCFNACNLYLLKIK